MMIVSCEIEEQHKVSIQTGSGLDRLLKNSDQNIKKIQKIETEKLTLTSGLKKN